MLTKKGTDKIISQAPGPTEECCAFCHRFGNSHLPLNGRPAPENIIRRQKIGDIQNVTEGSTLCQQCYTVLTEKRADNQWQHAWPSILFTNLTNASQHKFRPLWTTFLPLSLKNLWRHVAESQGINFSRDGCFRDITLCLKSFNEDIRSGHSGRLVKALNQTAFPSTRCPMGCLTHIDQINLIPINHLMQFECSAFHFCQANGNNFGGKKPHWPTAEFEFVGWRIRSGMIIDANKGLCIVACNDHKDPSYKYVLAPEHPITARGEAWQGWHKDCNAPIISTAHLANTGRSRNNLRFATVNQYTNTSGSNTISLAPDGTAFGPDPRMNQNTHTANVLPVVHRVDINRHAKSNKSFDHNYHVKAANQPGQPMTLEKHKKIHKNFVPSGTMVPKRDALEMALQYNEQQRKPNSTKKTLALNTYNRDTSNKHYRPILPAKQQHEMDLIITNSIFILQHNSPLRFEAYSLANTQPDDSNLNYLLKYLHRITHGNNLAILKKCRAMFNELMTEDDRRQTSSKQVVTFLHRMLPFIVIHDQSEENIDEEALRNDDFHLFYLGDREDNEEGTEFPQQFNNYAKMVETNIKSQDDFKFLRFNFRFEKNLQWRSILLLNGEMSDRIINHDLSNVCLYVSDERLHGRVQKTSFNFEGVQHYLKCHHHRNRHLLRATLEDKRRCGKLIEGNPCKNLVHLVCADSQCAVGLCKKHCNELILEKEEMFISDRTLSDENANGEEEEEDDGATVERYLLENDDLRVSDNVINQQNDPIAEMYSHYAEDVDAVPLTTNVIETPIFQNIDKNNDENTRLPGQYLFSSTLRPRGTAKSMFTKPPNLAQRWLQRLFSKKPDEAHPLLFPEAEMFPNIFYLEHDGTPIGALPSTMFSKMGNENNPGGLAPFKDHIKVRFKDFMNPTSRDLNYYSAMFDASLNMHLDNNNPLKVARKGLFTVNRFATETQRDLPIKTEQAESTFEVKKLAASFKDLGSWDYFVTFTCNTRETPGVAPITRAIVHGRNEDLQETQDLLQNAMSLILRGWRRFVNYFFNYIKYSPERPLGKVISVWYRYEWQSEDAAGNIPHIHGGIVIDKTNETEATMINRIRNRLENLFNEEDATVWECIKNHGLFKDWDDYIRIKTLISETSEHSCYKANSRCQKLINAEGKTVCRVPRHPDGLENWKEEKRDLYSKEVLQIFRESGIDTNNLPEKLRAYIFHYENTKHRHGIPIVPPLSVIIRSSTNVQRCDKTFCVRYVAKYAAATDEKKNATLAQDNEKRDNVVRISHDGLVNEKINSAKYAYNKQKNAKNSVKPIAKQIGLTEMYWFLLDHEYVKSDFKTKYVNCHSFENRSTPLKRSNNIYKKNLNRNGEMQTVVTRNGALWRRFKNGAKLHTKDTVEGVLILDPAVAFDIRPPELIAVDNLHDYTQWFDSESIIKFDYKPEIDAGPLTNGIGNVIKCRQIYLKNVDAFFTRLYDQLDEPTSLQDVEHNEMITTMRTLFHSLRQEQETKAPDEPYSDKYLRFVNPNETTPVAIVFSDASPDNPDHFLTHFILRHGRFTNEYDLFEQGNLLDAYEKAKLISNKNNVTREDLKRVLNKYIMDELVDMPITTAKI